MSKLNIPIESLQLDLQGVEMEIKEILPIDCVNDKKLNVLLESRRQLKKAIKILVAFTIKESNLQEK